MQDVRGDLKKRLAVLGAGIEYGHLDRSRFAFDVHECICDFLLDTHVDLHTCGVASFGPDLSA